jgi:hypothetical protein
MIKTKIDTPILVTGCERSGSSIVAKIISLCGVFTGELSNMQENKKIKEFVNKYYRSIRCDIRGQHPLPDTNEMIFSAKWKKDIENILSQDGYTGSNYWMYKESRICQIWPVWNTAFPNAKYIIVRRRTGDIIESCLKTGYMTAYKDRDGWLDWVHQHEKLFVEMIESGLNCKIVWPERMASGDYTQMHEMIDWLGLEWNDKIIPIVEILLLKSKQKEKGVEFRKV